jgi:DNA-binding GntR family transcriptional regulator
MNQQTIKRNGISEQVKDILLERILSGQYQPGQRLKELKIAGELGTSQAPVREAMRSLAAQGFIDHKPHYGSSVKRFSLRELLEVYEVRQALECFVIRREGPSLHQALPQLEACLAAMEGAAARGDLEKYTEYNTSFHRAIVSTANNQVLVDMWESLEIKSRVATTMFGTNLDPKKALQLHYPLIEAIKHKDHQVMLAAMEKHYLVIREHHESCS